MYTTRQQIIAMLPAPVIAAALDDDRDGQEDADLLETMQQIAEMEVAGLLGPAAPANDQDVPPVAVHAALVFIAEAVYRRSGMKDADNPWHVRAVSMRDKLAAISRGEVAITTRRTGVPGVVADELAFGDAGQVGL